MPLEITRCLCVPGAELAPPPPPVRRGPRRVMAIDTFGPMGKLATVVAGIVSCRLLVVGGATVAASVDATLSTSSRPGLGAYVHLVQLATLTAAHRGRGLPLLPVTLAGLPVFPSEM
jgi:hypothetical protein